MAKRKALEIGREGEKQAQTFLLESGYRILFTNWRAGKAEIDIVAEKDAMLVFVEVKTRTSLAFGGPLEALSQAQQKRLAFAATVFMEEMDFEGEIRFDLITIYWPPGRQAQLSHLEDVFFPGLEG
jgi:putative endonuclease